MHSMDNFFDFRPSVWNMILTHHNKVFFRYITIVFGI